MGPLNPIECAFGASPMTHDEELFFKQLGARIAELRKERALTQVRGPVPQLQQQIERIGQLPKAKQRFEMEMLETVLAQASR
jgi:hypothetical protein